ncbi:MAG: hypothetical protein LBR22_00935 [Desulfovibrio sp.]|jgi:hypothetical protein|nr:hypothetical protein [Desulfovibrio sp.]
MMLPRLLLCLLLAFPMPARSAESPAAWSADGPAACIKAIGDAVDRADVEEFKRRVDMDAILDDGVERFLKAASYPQVAEQLPPIAALIISQAQRSPQGRQSLKQLLVQQMSAFILRGVGSGAFGGRPSQGGRDGIPPLLGDASMGRKHILSIGEAKTKGNGWSVPFTVRDEGNGRNYPVVGTVRRESQGMRLVAVDNIDDIMQSIATEVME